MILLLDNQDSFTYNLFQLIEGLGRRVAVLRPKGLQTWAIEALAPKALIVSPGPGRPEEAQDCLKLVSYFKDKLPILGVCLGHQILGQAFGVPSVEASRLLYGKADSILHQNQGPFATQENPILQARYHSLVLKSLPKGFERWAWDQSGDLMAMGHQSLPLWGFQFHPESFMSPSGRRLVEAFFERI